MKRNRFGINLDEGIPLVSETDFELLYVSCFGETAERLHSWLLEGTRPLLLGGQIGSGKSTLINKVFLESGIVPDITFHFDIEPLNLDIGNYWCIVLAGAIETALRMGIDLKFCKLPQEIGPYAADNWEALLESLRPSAFTMTSFHAQIAIRKKIAENAEYIRKIIDEIFKSLKVAIERPLFVYAAGLDKYDPRSAGFFALQDIIAALAEYKTLFEVNAAHLFQKPGSPIYALDRLFISVLKSDAVVEMLSKRMGIYAQPIQMELKALAQWSGGNPRQAIRLLCHFETARKKLNRNTAENLAVAIRETAGDFFSYSLRPSADLIKMILRSAKVSATLFSLPGDKDTAQRALFGNWIFIDEKKEVDTWVAKVNPLVKTAFLESTAPQEPEIKLLHDYAAAANINATGLGLHPLDQKTSQLKSGDQLLWEFVASGVEQPIHTNLSETFDMLADALFSKDRADRVIIAYKEADITETARSYLFAKANSYEYQRCRHRVISGDPEKQPIVEIKAFLSEDTDIFSIEFSGRWDKAHLEMLNTQRDIFIDRQMLWWIPLDDLKLYLPCWTQLRQLFELYILEDELLGSISAEEIEADLSFFENLVDEDRRFRDNMVGNLKKVLDYLKAIKQRVDHG